MAPFFTCLPLSAMTLTDEPPWLRAVHVGGLLGFVGARGHGVGVSVGGVSLA